MRATASDGLTIRSSHSEDVPRIIELLKHSLGPSQIPRNHTYWSWKHLRNPFGSSPALVAESEGEIVGLRVFMRWRWRKGSEQVEAVRAVDTATHPEWQGRGIFTRLTLALVEDVEKEGISWVYNTPNHRSRPGYLKMGWRSLGRIDLWIRPHRPVRFIARRLKERNGLNGCQRPELGSAGSVVRVLQSPGLERLIEGRTYDQRLTTSVSKEYLNWRYCEVPEFQYRAAGEWRRGAEALVIYRLVEHNALRELRLCEILLGSEAASSKEASQLIREIVGESDPDFVSAIAARSTPERGVLVRSGFIPAPRLGPILTVRLLGSSENRSNIMHRSSWRFAIGDLELF